MLAVVLLGLLSTSPDVLLRSEPLVSAPVVARGIPREAMHSLDGALAAAVYQMRGSWYLVSIGRRKAWVRGTPEMVFHLYLDLVTRRPAVLTARWNGVLYADLGHAPAASQALRRALRREGQLGVRILSTRMYNAGLWLQIETPVTDSCGKRPSGLRSKTGWIPAFDDYGEPFLWFSTNPC